jgi:pimeloyl-ACP methyl ester carboxylesterase
MSEPMFGDVVVLLPGITGSVLVQGEGQGAKALWAPRPGAVLRGLLSLGRSLQDLTVENDDWRVDDLGDGVHATALVDAAHIIPGLWKIDVYSGVETALIERLGLTPGQNYFPFPYDWRRDNRASARRLQRQASSWLRAWQDRSGNADAQLVLVAHSMGGLVSRYFVEALGGWEMTRAVVTFGTPFYGSLNAVNFLVNGFHKGIGPFQSDLTPMLRSMSSVHQLVPWYRCIDNGGLQAVMPGEAGLPHWRPQWTEHLDSFQREMDAAARNNREDPRFEANPVAYHPITGCDQPTRQSAQLRDGSLAVLFDRKGKDEGGDGTVPLISSALSGTEPMRTFGPERHSRLQGNDGLLGHLGGLLSSLHDPKVADLRAIETRFSLVLDDVVLPGEAVRVGVKPISSLPSHLLRPEVEATITLGLEGGGIITRRQTSLIRDAINDIELGETAPGTYVVQVTADNAAPVSDVLAVASDQDVEGELSTIGPYR